MADYESEIKQLIVESLHLEDINPNEIDSTEPLFVEGLGLDSIDALELGIAIKTRWGIKIETLSDDIKAHFANVRSLAAFVQSQAGRK